ncbi:redox-sensing transcriptional repressor Rex [Candidatus Contubernalis alkaliaceticus]|uniref:redox-sensing transcriptional repressor Rex n=1 Tax=Candidatus Contubernalis alkaliaceticus TaxID=338645 RepID=UPI001F4C0B8A|nr:redox-sensing transcriptional repressor Rex [Candidatus Contubernalis alkalaceticus]UNC92679.1 redox-sensing transcriptional repressor Rex [Candidatus Contubernalis alkalaceticus]
MPRRNAPFSIIRRLPIYLRILDNLIKKDVDIISSRTLSFRTGFTAEQIRKDLAYFGAFGTRGTGYNTVYLRDKLLKIIALDKENNTVVIGSGHLGKAFGRYNLTKNPYISVVGMFDISDEVIGCQVEGLTIKHIDFMPEVIKEYNVRVAILTIPSPQAQLVVNKLVKLGIVAILNFAPTKLNVPEHVHVHNIDLTIELQSLFYYTTLETEKDI